MFDSGNCGRLVVTLVIILISSTGVYGTFDTAFQVMRAPLRGGCNANQEAALRTAYTDALRIVGLIETGINQMRAGTDTPATGWMFNVLFAVPSSEENIDYGEQLLQSHRNTLTSIEKLMDAIRRQDSGWLTLKDQAGGVFKTRIYCNYKWIKVTRDRIDPGTGRRYDPRIPMPVNADFWWDRETNIYVEAQTRPPPFDYGLGICGWQNHAVTSLELNTITFCQLFWDAAAPVTLGGLAIPIPESEPLVLLDRLVTLSAVFFHEWTHLVGRPDLPGNENVARVMPTSNQPEKYGFYDCLDLAADGGPAAALKNAHNYALLGTALHFPTCDWRSGGCRSSAFWADVRTQRIATEALEMMSER